MLNRLKSRIGWDTWRRTLYIVLIAQMFTAVGFSSIFPFLPLYVEDLGSVYGLNIKLLAGLVFSGQAVTMMIASPFWGRIADRFGRKLMIERAMYGAAIMLLWMGFVRSAEELVLARTIQGLISGTMAANNAMIASVAPRKRMGYAMGLLQVGLGSGIALGPLIGGVLADQFGFRLSFYITAGLIFLSGLLVSIGLKEDFTPPEGEAHEQPGIFKVWKEIFKTKGVAGAYLMRFSIQLGRMIPLPIAPFFIASLLKETDKLNTIVGVALGATSAAITISAIYLGRLGDRVGHRGILVISMFMAGVFYFPIAFVQNEWQLVILLVFAGIAIGGVIPSISALLAKYTQAGQEGVVYGLDNSIQSGGRAVAPLVGGGVAAWLGLRATFATTGVVLLAAALLGWLMLPKENVRSADLQSNPEYGD